MPATQRYTLPTSEEEVQYVCVLSQISHPTTQRTKLLEMTEADKNVDLENSTDAIFSARISSNKINLSLLFQLFYS
jgi:hypothetical protein